MKNKVLALVSFIVLSFSVYSQNELRLILAIKPTLSLSEESVFSKYPDVFDRKNTLTYGFGIGYQFHKKFSINTEFNRITSTIGLKNEINEEFNDFKTSHTSIPVYINWSVTDFNTEDVITLKLGLGGSFNYFGNTQVNYNIDNGSELYEGSYNYDSQGKATPGVLFTLGVEYKLGKFGSIEAEGGYHHIFPVSIDTEYVGHNVINGSFSNFSYSDKSEYSIRLFQLNIKYIFPISLF